MLTHCQKHMQHELLSEVWLVRISVFHIGS